MKIGSLFDGSGGFPLAAAVNGITPVWASEIEPFPIRVTTKRFPNMTHVGDICSLNGADLEPVDIISGGSPCQDLSVAGQRAGLVGERSGLFLEQIRIVKEMRKATNGKYPRYLVWENVPGAFSSNGGKDFGVVLEEICKVCDQDPEFAVPVPPKGKWESAGSIMGEHYSVAWRVLDAQYWGVPQRRRRIFLVADFGGHRAYEILFKRGSLQRYLATGEEPREGTAADAQGSIGEASKPSLAVCYGICSYDSNAFKSPNPNSGVYEATTSRTLDLNGGNPACHQGGIAILDMTHACDVIRDCGEVVPTLQNRMGTGGNQVPLLMQEAKCIGNGQANQAYLSDKVGALNAMHDQQAITQGHSVRRLTPLECCRLQGFPDWWTEGLAVPDAGEDEIAFFTEVFAKYGKPKTRNQIIKWLKDPYSDSALYKMWGNGVALPCVEYIMEGIAERGTIDEKE